MKRMRKVVSTLLLVCVLASILVVGASAEGLFPDGNFIIPDGAYVQIDHFSKTPFTVASDGSHTVELKLSGVFDPANYMVVWSVDGNTKQTDDPAASYLTYTIDGKDYAQAGTHTLTVQVCNKNNMNQLVAEASVNFTVTAVPQAIKFDKTVVNLDSFNTYMVNNARVIPESADQSVVYASDDPSIATVDMDGTVHAVASGSTKITATSTANGVSGFYTVNVTIAASNISLDINESYIELDVDEAHDELVATINSEASSSGLNNSITWESSDPAVVSVFKTGANTASITAKNYGTATIRAYTTDGSALYDECIVVVTPKDEEAAKVTISPLKTNLVPGETVKLNASVVGTDYVSTWYSTDPNSVQISANGNTCTVKALKVSSEPIEIHAITKFNKMEATAFIYIGESEILELAASATSVKEGDSVSVSVNNARQNETFTWSFTPNDGTIVKSSYTKNNALIMSIGEGEGTITVNCVSNMDATRKASVVIGANGVDPYGSAYISPKSVNWTYGSGDLSFQVYPAIYWAYLDNQYLNTKSTSLAQYWNGTLTLKSSYLQTLSNGTHTLKIYTAYDQYNNPTGLVYANIYISGNGTSGAGAAYGDNAHVKGSASNLYFNSSATIDDVYISGKWIDPKNDSYSLSTDGKTITLNASFLNQLAYGTYTMTLNNDAGSTQTTNFRIVTANYAPSTGDEANVGLWIAIMLLSGAGAVALIPRRKSNMN